MDVEYESPAEREKFWADAFADPGAPAELEKFRELLASRTTNELWNLE